MRSMVHQFLLVLTAALLHPASAFVPSGSSHAFVGARSSASRHLDTRRYNFIDSVQSMYKNFGKQVTVSHILIGPQMTQEDARKKLEEVKAEIGDDLDKFAEMAGTVSTCRASKGKGGDLGKFGPGLMVPPFDKACFEEEVGKVHGPVSTCFGEHLIFIRDRS